MTRSLSVSRLFAPAMFCALKLAFAQTPDELMDKGHFKRARAALSELPRPRTDIAAEAYQQSRLEMAFGNLDAALKQAERAVQLDGRNPKYHFQLASVCKPAAEKAGTFKKLGLAKRMREELETTLWLDGRHVEARLWLMMFHLKAPGIAGGDKDKATQKAEELFRRAVEADPKSYAAQVALADYYGSQKKYALEEKHAQLALGIDGSRASAHARLAEAMAATQTQEAVDEALAKAETAVPDNLLPYFTAGVALLTENRDLPRAERYLRKYLTQDPEGRTPSHAVARWRLALVLEKLGRKPEAIAQLESAVRADPDFDKPKHELKRLK